MGAAPTLTYKPAERIVHLEHVDPPPTRPAYDHLFGNQIRWAIQVIRYTLFLRRLNRTHRTPSAH